MWPTMPHLGHLTTQSNWLRSTTTNAITTATPCGSSFFVPRPPGEQSALAIAAPRTDRGFPAYGIVATLKHRNPAESLLAERAALCAWRLRRCYPIEAAMFENVRRNWGNGAAAVMTRIENLFIRVTAHDDHLAKLTRYETSIERSLMGALFALRQLRTP